MKWIVMMLPLMLAGCAQSQHGLMRRRRQIDRHGESGRRLLRPEGR